MAGALLFGVPGALIGGRVKKKDISTVDQYLVFTFLSDQESRVIIFDVTGAYGIASKFVKEFSQYNPGRVIQRDL